MKISKMSKISTAAFFAGVTTLSVSLPVMTNAAPGGEVGRVEVVTSVQKPESTGSDFHLD